MKDLVKAAVNLLKIKSLVTLTVMFVFAFLALKGNINPDNVMNVVVTVIAFYFGTQYAKHEGNG